MADKRRRLFEQDTSGFAFREVFTPLREEGPLPPRPKRSGVGGGPQKKAVTGSVWSTADATVNAMTLSNGGLTVTPSGNVSWTSVRSTQGKSSGKLYFEVKISVAPTTQTLYAGIASSGFNVVDNLGNNPYSVGIGGFPGYVLASTGFVAVYGGNAFTVTVNDVLAVAVDFTAGEVRFAQNNVWMNGNNPVATFTPATVGQLFPTMSFSGASGVWTLQATAASQKYLPPPGFQAWDGGPVTPPPASVWSATDAAANGMTLSNGGLTVTPSAGGSQSIRNTISKTSGKLYIEFLVNIAGTASFVGWGLASTSFNPAGYLGGTTYSGGAFANQNNFVSSGFTDNGHYISPTTIPGVNDVWALALDFGAGYLWVAQNNAWFGGGNPATGTLPNVTFAPATVGALFATMTMQSASGVWTLQPTAASQKYAPPAGFSPWG